MAAGRPQGQAWLRQGVLPAVSSGAPALRPRDADRILIPREKVSRCVQGLTIPDRRATLPHPAPWSPVASICASRRGHAATQLRPGPPRARQVDLGPRPPSFPEKPYAIRRRFLRVRVIAPPARAAAGERRHAHGAFPARDYSLRLIGGTAMKRRQRARECGAGHRTRGSVIVLVPSSLTRNPAAIGRLLARLLPHRLPNPLPAAPTVLSGGTLT